MVADVQGQMEVIVVGSDAAGFPTRFIELPCEVRQSQLGIEVHPAWCVGKGEFDTSRKVERVETASAGELEDAGIKSVDTCRNAPA